MLDGFTTGEPGRDRQVQPGRRSDPDRALDGRPGRQPARPRGGRRSRASCATSSSRDALKPLDFAESTINDNFSEGAVEAGTVDGKLYGLLFKAANKSTVWYNVPLFEEAGVEPPEDFDAFLEAAKTLRASGTQRLLDRRLGRLDAHGHVREHLPAPGRSREVRPARHARHPVDRPVGEGRARDDGADRRRHGQHRGRHLGRARDRLPDVGHQRLQGQPRRARRCSRATSWRA